MQPSLIIGGKQLPQIVPGGALDSPFDFTAGTDVPFERLGADNFFEHV